MQRNLLFLLLATSLALPAQAQLSDVALRPGDGIQLTLFPDPGGYSGVYQIQDDGDLVLPEIGRVLAQGVPVSELRAVVEREYSTTVRDRVVTIRPQFSVGVLGAVRSPSVYAVSTTDNVFDVIARAGGFGPGADMENVRIVREGEVIPIDALLSLETGVNLDTYKLRPGDQIMVPPKGGISLRTVFEVVRTVSTLAILIDRLGN